MNNVIIGNFTKRKNIKKTLEPLSYKGILCLFCIIFSLSSISLFFPTYLSIISMFLVFITIILFIGFIELLSFRKQAATPRNHRSYTQRV